MILGQFGKMSNGLPTSGGVSVEELPEKMDKSLQKENKRLKVKIVYVC